MKKLDVLAIFFLVITIFSCSSDNDSTENTNTKKLTKIIHKSNQYEFIQNVIYNNKGEVVEIKDGSGLVLTSNKYDNSGKLIKHEFNEYNNGVLYFKEIDDLLYNDDNKISNIKHNSFRYNSDGSILSQNSINNNITYSNNSMIKTSDDFRNTRVEYGFTNNFITSIKVYKNNILKNNMAFNYDADGNCISGTGSINEGSSDSTTDNIDLKVTYGTKEKASFFNLFFEHEILSYTSFHNLRQVLINQQGTKYPEIIQWYKYSNYKYKETYENIFDNDGNIVSKNLSEFPDYPNYGTISYTWE